MNGGTKVDETQLRLAYARWLLGLIAKKMVESPDGTARLVMPAHMVRCIRCFVAEAERGS